MPCYLIHADVKLHNIQHYIGWTTHKNVWRRLEDHRAGRGSRLTKAFVNKKITFRIVRIWPNGNKSLERDLKDHHKAKDLCPICNSKLNLSIPIEGRERIWE